ncbi:MAG: prolyl oligopeptidase family serine peptidase, partial [Pseudomonadota bacterium]
MGRLFLLYSAYVLALSFAFGTFVYPFDPEPFVDPDWTQRSIIAPDGTEIPVAMRQGDRAAPVLLYFIGNGGSRRFFRTPLNRFADAGFTVVTMAYRGGEGVPGLKREATLKSDALALYDQLGDVLGFEPRVVHAKGYSLGTGVAAHVAAEREVGSLLLLAPYDRLCRLMGQRSYTPACQIPWIDRWDSAALMEEVTAPVMIVHGRADELIPVAYGERLAAAAEAAGRDVTARYFDGVGHSGFLRTTAYDEMIAFVKDHS